MKKLWIVFVGLLVLGIGTLVVLPGFVLQEADKVQITEHVLSGDSATVEGVTVTGYSHYNGQLFWNTVYTAGEEATVETEYDFSVDQKLSRNRADSFSWNQERGYGCFQWMSGLSGGWGMSSNGGLSITNDNIERRELTAAYEALAAETKAGEENSKMICLNDYMTYYPLEINLQDSGSVRYSFNTEELSEAYASYFKIPIEEIIDYEIKMEKDENGKIISLGGGVKEFRFQWNVASVCTDTDIYFTFCPYSGGKRLDTSLIPGGFGIYRQPYRTENGETIIQPEKLEVVYALSDDFYAGDTLLLDVNARDQLLILTDNETETCFQVVDLETLELVQEGKFPHAEADARFVQVVRVTDEFLVLHYEKNYFTVVDWQEDRGYAHQFTMQVAQDDVIYNFYWQNQNDFDWNGEQLIFTCYSMNQFSVAETCNFDLAVYDATGQIYHGLYTNSLATEQEYDKDRETIHGNLWQGCEPGMNDSIDVDWP
ncbi:MAG: hypothetical protein J6K04_08780 [Lachnospiraceae bacterium]|nr:hypothetical protein [Lachnospiraceae bacterium]